ncbi:7TM-DISM domain-containing protein [Limnohabitans sp. DCL3]|uniref:sensor histidine kinase n=1 Tax=Limnohabitans sp. DCL3 TaxID=3374103 RepID=UPI003A849825
MSIQCPWGPFLKRWVCLLWGIVALWGPTAAWAQDRILEKTYWTDTTGSASFEQARSAPYTPYKGVLSKGFGRDVQWVRLEMDGMPPNAADKLVLRIRPVFLDHITLYDPLELDQGIAPRTTGDRTPFAETEFESLHHTFLIQSHQAKRYVWLRLSTSSTQLMHVEALSQREMLREEHALWLAYSALLAVLFSCLMWVFISWQQDRDPVNGVFVLRQTVLLIYTACYLGYHRILFDGVLSARQQDSFYSWALLLTTMLTFVFEYRILNEYAISRWGRYVLRTGLAASLLALVFMAMGRSDWALPLNTLLVGMGMLSMFVISFSIRPQALKESRALGRYLLPRRAISLYYGLAVSLLAVSIMPSLGLLQGTLISIYGVLLYGLLSGLLMTALLIVRSRQMERLRREQANHLFLSREQLAIETRRRQDQSQLLNMLMHELKTPLAVIDLALKDRAATDKAQSYVGRAIDNMKSILNRCVQTDRLIERPFAAHVEHFDLAQQVAQWVQDNPQTEGRMALQIALAAPVDSDVQCVQIIASNLIENALKYGDPKQPVQLSLQLQPHADGRIGWSLMVRNAPGVAGRPDADKVFAKYYRSAAAQRQSGTGLGLYLSHNLAQQIGAELRYQTTDTTICFELWLPT